MLQVAVTMESAIPVSLVILVSCLGLCGGVLSGVLGLGGGILMTPLLLYSPAAFGQPALSMRVVAGLTIVQSLFASFSGAVAHHERGSVHAGLAAWLGATMAVSAFAGAASSGFASSETLLALFALLAVVAAVLMLVPQPGADEERALETVTFSIPRAIAVGAGLGFVGGMVGQSGAFILIPVMIHLFGVPVRIAIGTTLAVVLLAAVAGTAGKLVAGQVVLPLALALVPPAIIGARIGARWSRRARPSVLRHALALVIAGAAIRMCYDLVTHGI